MLSTGKLRISKNEKSALQALRAEVLKRYNVLDFRIFGSKTKGTETADSDLDVMILLDKSTPDIESSIDDLIFEINLKFDCLISALYFNQNEVENGPLSESPLYKKVLREGVRL